MKRKRRSPGNQDRLYGLHASVVYSVLSACLAGLWLICAGGCPSKASQDSNQPPTTVSPASPSA